MLGITKDNAKQVGWTTFVSAFVSIVTFIVATFGTGGKPSPAPYLPKPDENVPISVAKEYYCEAGSSIVIEPKFIGAIKWSVPTPFQDKLKLFSFPNNEKAFINVNKDVTGIVYIAINGAYKDKDGAFLPTEVIYVKINTAKGPNPGPVPTPTFPDGKYKLSKSTYDLVLKTVNPEYRHVASNFAKNYEGIASKIAAGGYNSSKSAQTDILSDTTEANKASLKELQVDGKNWDSFFTAFSEVVYNLYQARSMVTKEDFEVAWREISQGFSGVPK